MNDWQCFDVSMDGGVAHVRMNHPERHNSMVPAFWSELPRLLRRLDEASGTRVMVLSSVGRHFTAGMDLAVFESAGTLGTANVKAREQFRQQLKQLQESFNAIANACSPDNTKICVPSESTMARFCRTRSLTAVTALCNVILLSYTAHLYCNLSICVRWSVIVCDLKTEGSSIAMRKNKTGFRVAD